MPAPGELFARRYRLVRVLGRGAMGVVHEAIHEPLGHRVAIKMLRPGSADDDHAVRRFEREARLAAKLTSPHVVKVLDVDRTESGDPYLVMELLEGRDLSQEVDDREKAEAIPIETAVSWVLAICEAMTAAHDAGIVHRDLKLSNVFLTKDGVIKVLDFGVASFRGGDTDASTTAAVAGTPRYMAPEQLLGEAPNPASDIWAAGVILYRLLTGRFPYDASTMAAQMLAIMDGEPRIEDLAPHIPKELALAVHRALGRTLEERWAAMPMFRAALLPFGAAATETPAPIPRFEGTAQRPGEQRRWRRFVIAPLLITAGVGIAFALRRPEEAIPTRTVTLPTRVEPSSAPVQSSPTTAATATTLASAASTVPTSVAPPRVVPPRPSARPAASGDGFPNHL